MPPSVSVAPLHPCAFTADADSGAEPGVEPGADSGAKLPTEKRTRSTALWPLLCLAAAFFLAVGIRLLELPFWDNPAYSIDGEFLLATHDAYHWVAGAEGFEFGTGHPMSELARLVSVLVGCSPALAAFWLPPFMSGLLAAVLCLWCAGLGRPFAGLCAGVLLSLSPSFCARTLLGFYDTDLVILLFSVLVGLVPALWLAPWLRSVPAVALELFCRKRRSAKNTLAAQDKKQRAALARDCLHPGWMALLLASGAFAHWMQEWHSFFPYLVRYSLLLLPLSILILGRAGSRRFLLGAALCYAFPLALGGGLGLAAGAALALYLLRFERPLARRAEQEADSDTPEQKGRGFVYACAMALRHNWLFAAWLAAVFFAWDASVLSAMLSSFASYADRGGDVASFSPSLEDPLVFPSVAQSIIEVQTISLSELLVYTYPLASVALAALGCYAVMVLFCPAFAWLAPLLVLSLLSMKMGARMTMFGPAALFPALCMIGGYFLEWGWGLLQRERFLARQRKAMEEADYAQPQGMDSAEQDAFFTCQKPLKAGAAVVLCLALAWPMTRYLPDYTQGPILSREQAEALAWMKDFTEADSLVWNWWDWGYATHHFSRRQTIADGARHGGPSLYLPAAVYTTADPRFARQVIKHAALCGNIPGKFFEGLGAKQAQALMAELGNPEKPLIKAPGRQYLVVSFEMLRLGLWVTRYGSWNFVTKQGPGALMNNLTPALRYNVDKGIIMTEGMEPVFASDIVIFGGHKLERYSFNRYGAYHFLFNTQRRVAPEPQGLVADFWRTVRGPGVFASSVADKMAMDTVFFNTMMVQLLVREPDDPFISPYFHLVFDNAYTRIYEVL